ncbi:MAG: PIN domain-containing protein [Thermoplasmata archaeon]
MKALDTSALLALLSGDRAAKDLLHRVRGVEVATTEINLLELGYAAARGPVRHRGPRRATLSRLRRKLTVLPLDDKAVEEASGRLARGATGVPPLRLAMLSILEVNGCEELLSSEVSPLPGKWRFKRVRFGK